MSHSQTANRERVTRVWVVLPALVAVLLVTIAMVPIGGSDNAIVTVPLAAVVIALSVLMIFGFFTLQPNEARVLVLFGRYMGTVRESGFHWGNPFYTNGMRLGTDQHSQHLKKSGKTEVQAPARRGPGRNKLSLRARTLNGEKLKVNDSGGNPIEIGAVVVWRVQDTAQAMFDVDDYENYVQMQSESALRHLASQYSYDGGETGAEITLRGHVEEVSLALGTELEDRLKKAGVLVDEARLTHLAYAPEIAQVMLRRQQAEAVIAARGKIVHGAVSMVSMALQELAEKGVVQLDDERRAAMVSNLMVVLCGEAEVHPVVNAGTLYN
jgi:regulator of protease activity HflC (stomatin/prohibitin superfamily)